MGNLSMIAGGVNGCQHRAAPARVSPESAPGVGRFQQRVKRARRQRLTSVQTAMLAPTLRRW